MQTFKNFLSSIVEAIIIIGAIPFLILLFIFWIVPVVIIDSIKEKDEEDVEDKEQVLYHKYCDSCPQSKWCHEEATTCDMYGEALEKDG